jgi:hypothetical protein
VRAPSKTRSFAAPLFGCAGRAGAFRNTHCGRAGNGTYSQHPFSGVRAMRPFARPFRVPDYVNNTKNEGGTCTQICHHRRYNPSAARKQHHILRSEFLYSPSLAMQLFTLSTCLSIAYNSPRNQSRGILSTTHFFVSTSMNDTKHYYVVVRRALSPSF